MSPFSYYHNLRPGQSEGAIAHGRGLNTSVSVGTFSIGGAFFPAPPPVFESSGTQWLIEKLSAAQHFFDRDAVFPTLHRHGYVRVIPSLP